MRFHSAHVVENARENKTYELHDKGANRWITLRAFVTKETALPTTGRALLLFGRVSGYSCVATLWKRLAMER